METTGQRARGFEMFRTPSTMSTVVTDPTWNAGILKKGTGARRAREPR